MTKYDRLNHLLGMIVSARKQLAEIPDPKPTFEQLMQMADTEQLFHTETGKIGTYAELYANRDEDE